MIFLDLNIYYSTNISINLMLDKILKYNINFLIKNNCLKIHS